MLEWEGWERERVCVCEREREVDGGVVNSARKQRQSRVEQIRRLRVLAGRKRHDLDVQ